MAATGTNPAMTVGSAFGRIGLRGRMMILIGTAMLPLAISLAFSIRSDYVSTLRDARKETLQSANLAAARQSRIFETSRVLLDTLQHTPGVAIAGGPECEHVLAEVKNANPQFLSVGIMDANGVITCHNTLRARQAFTEPTLMQRLLVSDAPDFIVGEFMIGTVTQQPTIAIASAMKNASGQTVGAVFASLDLARLSRAAESVSVGGRRTIAIIQPASGRMITHFPELATPFGTSFADNALIAAMQASPNGGVTEAIGFDGADRIFGFAPIEGGETGGIMLAVGESRDYLLAPVVAHARFAIMIGPLAIALALTIAWFLADHLQLRPVLRLTRSASRIGAGQFTARAAIEDWHASELRELGETLDRMAARLADGRRAEQAIAASETRFRLLAENSLDIISCVDQNGKRTFVSPSCREVVGFEPEELIGTSPRDLAHPDDVAAIDEMMASLWAGESVTGLQFRFRHRAGHYVWIEATGRRTDAEGQIVCALRDISERKKIEDDLARANRKLSSLASTDALTSLLNRRAFDDALNDAFRESAETGSSVNLLLIDVDDFKKFNDAYGHPAGDECLRRVAMEIGKLRRRPGVATARYGGEEFAIILPNAPLSEALAEAETLRLAMHRLAIPHQDSEHRIVTISIGVATCSGAQLRDAVDLIRMADHALYAAKAGGRDRTEMGFAAIALAS